MAADYEVNGRSARKGNDTIEGAVDLNAPLDQMWRLFSDVPGWPSWNTCMAVARVRPGQRLVAGATLIWAFRPIKRRYLYRLPAVARLTVVEEQREVTWEVALPGFHARHTYSFTDLGEGRCRFESWERASGPVYRLLRPFWLAHFRFVRDASLTGATEAMSRHEGAARLVRYGDVDKGTPLLVVPGLDGSIGTLSRIVDELARWRPVYVVDFRTERNPTLEALSAEIAALVRSAGLPHVDTVATSLGCMVAAQTLGDHGIPYGRAVLIGAFTVLDSRRLRLTNRIVSLLPRRLYQLGAPLLMAWVCGPVGNGRRHPFFGWIRRSDPTQVVKRTRWEIDRDFALELKKLTRPTLVLMGSEDRFVRDVDTEVAAITRALSHPESEVRMVPDAGHVFLPSGAAQTAVRAIRMFLNYSKEEV